MDILISMIKRLNELISKYGDKDFEAMATKLEKEQAFLLKRAITLEYEDKYKFAHRNRLDFLVNTFVKDYSDIETLVFDQFHPYFSFYSPNEFQGETNITNPSQYRLEVYPEVLNFKSVYQFLVFHKSVLFLDRESANQSLKTADFIELSKINLAITDFNDQVWTEYKTMIVEAGFRSLLENNSIFRSQLETTGNKILVFQSDNEVWGIDKQVIVSSNKIIDLSVNRNYLGKILTKIKLNLS